MRKFLTLTFILLVFTGFTQAEAPRETSKTLEMIEGEPSYYVKPPVVQAGHSPVFVGEVFRSPFEIYPGLHKLKKDEASFKTAMELSTIAGLNTRISSFMVAGWDDIRGVPLAFVVDDLIEAGYSGTHRDVRTGLLDIFRIELSTPEHNTVFPIELLLHTEYTKGDQSYTTIGEMVSEHRDGVYRLQSIDRALMELDNVFDEFGPPQGFKDVPRKMHLSKLTGFDPNVAIKDLPQIEGAMLIHHVYLGSYRVTSGWQWIGRPEGLFESQQKGFVQ